MKDVAHHMKYVQKKLLQESRREAMKETLLQENNEEKAQEIERPEKKFDPNHRTPRIFPKRDYH